MALAMEPDALRHARGVIRDLRGQRGVLIELLKEANQALDTLCPDGEEDDERLDGLIARIDKAIKAALEP